jgi:site-specific DNA recombinase
MHKQAETLGDGPVAVAIQPSADPAPAGAGGELFRRGFGQTHVAGIEARANTSRLANRKGQVPTKRKPPVLTDYCRAGWYGRYSTSDQKETSLEDQLRRCREVAARYGATIPDDLTFSDAAISGSEKGRSKRAGFDKLIAAIEADEIDLLVVDELCRLARDVYELAKFDRLTKQKRVRVITADGLDSESPSWSLQIAVMGAMAQQALKETKHRVRRGMEGQLERGWMIACPPFGYRAIQEVGANGKPAGTRWEIVEAEAATVRQIFESRAHGQSYLKIAKTLNAQGIVPGARKRKRQQKPTWMPACINRILSNPIYKGQFIYHGSTTYLARQAEAGLEPEDPVIYPRPQLRIVADEMWAICNDGRVSRSGYGGGSQLMAGLVTCGFCQSVLNVSSPSHGRRTLTCGICNQERAVGGRTETPGYVAVTGVEFLLKTLIQANLGAEMQDAFRSRLRERLAGGQAAELEAAEVALARADRLCRRLAESMGQVAEDDPYLLPQFRKARQTCTEAEQTVIRLRDQLALIDTQALDAQLDVDPAKIVDLLFTETIVPVERKRAILSRLFPRITTHGKTDTRETLFEIDMVPGAILAELTQTGVLINDVVRYRVLLKCCRARQVVWQVVHLPGDH